MTSDSALKRKPRENEWTSDELSILKNLYPDAEKSEIFAQLPGRSWPAIYTKAFDLNIARERSNWTQKELNILREIYSTRPTEEILIKLPAHDWNSIGSKARKLQLKRPNFAVENRRLAAGKKLLDIVHSYKAEFLSPSYETNQNNYKFKCFAGHIFEMQGMKVLAGSWCKLCTTGLHQRLCQEYFEQMFGYKFPCKRPKWLAGLELDGYCEELNMAFEYNGGQHYKYTPFFQNTHEDFSSLQFRDEKKIKLCKQHGVQLIIIPELTIVEFKSLVEIIKEACKKVNQELLTFICTEKVDPAKAYLPQELVLFQELQKIAKDKDGVLESHAYLGCDVNLLWYCNKHQYQWWACPYTIRKVGCWCPKCGGTLPKGLEYCHQFATSKKGFCLADEYKNVKAKMPWKCSITEHSIFFSTLERLENRNKNLNKDPWCPECDVLKSPTVS